MAKSVTVVYALGSPAPIYGDRGHVELLSSENLDYGNGGRNYEIDLGRSVSNWTRFSL